MPWPTALVLKSLEEAPTILGHNRKMIREPRRCRRLTENGGLILIPEPAKQSSEEAKLDLLTLEPGVQSTVGHRGRRIAAIERVCLGYEGVVGRAAVARGLRACLLRFTGPVWITRHHRLPALK